MHSGYIMQPQKLPNFPLRRAMGFPQSGQLGAEALAFAREQAAHTGAPWLFSLVASFPQKEHFPGIEEKKGKILLKPHIRPQPKRKR